MLTSKWPVGAFDERSASVAAKQLKEAWGQFLGLLPWQLFVTLTFDLKRVFPVNPNVFTNEQFDELVAEVQHLRHPAKPIVVRQHGDRYEIVDGEHSWRAARQAGLRQVPCEVIKVDDFEAKRQTFKRNQHGVHDHVLLGRMFLSMMEARGLSQRDLAAVLTVGHACRGYHGSSQSKCLSGPQVGCWRRASQIRCAVSSGLQMAQDGVFGPAFVTCKAGIRSFDLRFVEERDATRRDGPTPRRQLSRSQ